VKRQTKVLGDLLCAIDSRFECRSVEEKTQRMTKGKRVNLVVLKLVKGCHKFGLADDDKKINSWLKVLGFILAARIANS